MTWPTRAPRKRKPAKARDTAGRILAPSEHLIQVRLLASLTILAAPGVYWFAIPNAGKRSANHAMKMKAEGLRAGVADLCIMLPGGRSAFLELKKPGGRLSPEQKAFGETCKFLGHPWACAWSVTEALTYLRAWGALRENVTMQEAAE